MPENQRRDRHGASLGRHAGAWLVIASLCSLFLGQPLHAGAQIGAAAGVSATLALSSAQLPSQTSPHDAGGCSLCRAIAQSRLGLRVALRLGALAANGPHLPLLLPAPSTIGSAPRLREAQPRAPPSTSLLLAA